jgi:hypothetical protein
VSWIILSVEMGFALSLSAIQTDEQDLEWALISDVQIQRHSHVGRTTTILAYLPVVPKFCYQIKQLIDCNAVTRG